MLSIYSVLVGHGEENFPRVSISGSGSGLEHCDRTGSLHSCQPRCFATMDRPICKCHRMHAGEGFGIGTS